MAERKADKFIFFKEEKTDKTGFKDKFLKIGASPLFGEITVEMFGIVMFDE